MNILKLRWPLLRELDAPNLETQPLSLTYPILDRPLKLNSGFLNLLPKFHGLPGEDPYRHVNKLCASCRQHQIFEQSLIQ